MKIKNNIIIKKLILSLMLVIMVGNFIMPTSVQAIDGGDLAKPIFQFVAWLGDVVLDFLQVNVAGNPPMGVDYNITYSLGNIFSNKIALFDVNFIKPNTYQKTISSPTRIVEPVEEIWNGKGTSRYDLGAYGFDISMQPKSIGWVKHVIFSTHEYKCVWEWETSNGKYRLVCWVEDGKRGV